MKKKIKMIPKLLHWRITNKVDKEDLELELEGLEVLQLIHQEQGLELLVDLEVLQQ